MFLPENYNYIYAVINLIYSDSTDEKLCYSK